MKKSLKKLLMPVIIIAMLVSTFAINAFAWDTLNHDQVYKSYLAFTTTFTGDKRSYTYNNVGYEYQDCSCSGSGYFDVELWQDGSWGKNVCKGSCENSNINTGSTWWGWTFNNSKSGNGKMWFKFIPHTNGNRIKADHFVMFSDSQPR